MRGKTKLMLSAEENLGKPLEDAIPGLVNELGLVGAADAAGVSKATLAIWLLKMGLRTQFVTYPADAKLEIVHTDGRRETL